MKKFLTSILCFMAIILVSCTQKPELGVLDENENIPYNEPTNMKLVLHEGLIGESYSDLPLDESLINNAYSFILINDGSINNVIFKAVKIENSQWKEIGEILKIDLSKGENEFILEDCVVNNGCAYISVGENISEKSDIANTIAIESNDYNSYLNILLNSENVKKDTTVAVTCWVPRNDNAIDVFGSMEYEQNINLIYENPEKTMKAFEECYMILATFK